MRDEKTTGGIPDLFTLAYTQKMTCSRTWVCFTVVYTGKTLRRACFCRIHTLFLWQITSALGKQLSTLFLYSCSVIIGNHNHVGAWENTVYFVS